MRTIYCTSATPHCPDAICFGLVIFFVSVAKVEVASDVGIQVETGLELKA